MDDEEKELKMLPRLSKTACGKRPKLGQTTEDVQGNTLFKTGIIDSQTSHFDIIQPGLDDGEHLLRAGSPSLYAFRSKVVANSQKPMFIRPKTSNTNPSNHLPSMLVKRPLSNLREPVYDDAAVIQKRIIEERNSISFKEDPIAYFSKRKDGRGHLFIYMNHAGNRKDPNFSPYELMKVPFDEVNPEYFTMSHNGVTHILPDGTTEHVSLDRWAKELAIYGAIRKLKMFRHYFFWKNFRIWRNFVMRQRYLQLSAELQDHSFFNNPSFFGSSLEILTESSDAIVKQYLLQFQTQKKYRLEVFKQITKDNRESLREEFHAFLNAVLEMILTLDADIRDPQRTIVKDSDFPQFKLQNNPKLGQLLDLEIKKTEERTKRNATVHKEIMAFGQFIRMMDYLLIESLVKSCTECWEVADANLSQDMASVFEIEISFSDDGKVVFSPTLEELIETVSQTLDNSIKTLNSLPRLLMQTPLRPHLRESQASLSKLFEEGPNFSKFLNTNCRIQEIKEHIIEVITHSYHEAEEHSQLFIEFFPIYQTGLLWDPKNYIHPRGGPQILINLSKSAYSNEKEDEAITFDPSTELVVDFKTIYSDIERFKQDEIKLTQFRACSVKGALYIDSRQLRSTLTPIPVKSLQALQNSLRDLMQKKIDSFSKIFRFCSKKFKKEPSTLEQYVDFCDFIDRTNQLKPLMATEIGFVDQMFSLFENSGLAIGGNLDHSKNPLHAGFYQFQNDQNTANQTKDQNSEKFINILLEKLQAKAQKITRYHELFTYFPSCLANADIEVLLPNTKKLREKFVSLEPEIEELTQCQLILDIQSDDLSSFQDVMNESTFMEQLYEAVSQWLSINREIVEVPMMNVDFSKFKNDILSLEQVLEAMSSGGTPPQLLTEVMNNVEQITPFLDQLEMLASGKMQLHHWNKLFTDCGQSNAYYGQIKIDELISLGILGEREKIAAITSTSQGESQLEMEFQVINNEWKTKEIPLLEGQVKGEDQLLLGDTTELFQEIADTQIKLQNMLNIPFVQGIKENILTLSSTLETIAQILESWKGFQLNWQILSVIFSNEDISTVLPQSHNKFMMVKRRWINIVRHANANPTLHHICSYPTLLDLLHENNNSLTQILLSLEKYLDYKRGNFPRLFFLSNDEVLRMISTNDFSIVCQVVVKLFMNIKSIDFQSQDSFEAQIRQATNEQNFQRIKIFGLVGEDGSSFQFTRHVQCGGPIEQWLSQLVDFMKSSVRDNIINATQSYQSMPIDKWVVTVPTYIAILVAYISFSREIDECFNNFENNIRVFSEYETKLIEKYKILCAAICNPHETAANLMKISNLSTVFSLHMSSIKQFAERKHFYSTNIKWHEHMRMHINIKTNQLLISYGDKTIEHSYEYYGTCDQLVHSFASTKAMNNLVASVFDNEYPFLYGSQGIGKNIMISNLGALFGKFVFYVQSFSELPTGVLDRLFMGTAGNGAWIVFSDLEKQKHSNLCHLFDTMANFIHLRQSGNLRVNIHNTFVQFDKTCNIFMTGRSSFFTSCVLPPHLKSILKPIAFAAPDIPKIIEIKLDSYGFQYPKEMARKLFTVFKCLSHAFGYIKRKTILKPILVVIKNAMNIMQELQLNSNVSYLSYYEEPQTCEAYSIARSIYTAFHPYIRRSHMESFLQIIYASFKIFETYDMFKVHIISPGWMNESKFDDLLSQEIQKYIESLPYELPVDFLKDRALCLYHLMQQYPIIFISGDTNSGKSLVVKILENAIKNIEGQIPLHIIDVYHESYNADQIYGMNNQDSSNGYINSYFYELMSKGRDKYNILRFNGPMTHDFSAFLSGMIPYNKCCLPSLDSFSFEDNFSIFVETDILEHLNPSLLQKCGVLTMRNIQIYRNLEADQSTCEVSNPQIIFSRVVSENPTLFTESDFNIFKDKFIQMAPDVVTFIYHISNHIYYSESQQRIPGGAIILSDVLPYHTLHFVFNYFHHYRLDSSNKDLVHLVMAFSFFTIFSAVIDSHSVTTFDTWIRASYGIELPPDWVGFNVPDHFWDAFPRPCLESMQILGGKLAPLDFSILEELPFLRRNDRSLDHQFLRDVCVCTATYLPRMHEAQLLINTHNHFLLYGPRSSGKSTFLEFAFKGTNDVIPILIPVGPLSTEVTLLNFITTHTPVTTKDYVMQTKKYTYALIFDNVRPEYTHAIEFIRMITRYGSAPLLSSTDPKFFNLQIFKNYFVICVSDSINKFTSRFISNFIPIQITPPSINTVKHIATCVGRFFEVDTDFIDKVFSIIPELPQDVPFQFNNLLEVICFVQQKRIMKPADKDDLIDAIREEFNFFYLHKNINENEIRKFGFIFDTIFPPPVTSIKSNRNEGNSYFFPESKYNEANNNVEIIIQSHQISLLKEELEFYYSEFNRSTKDNLIIKFYRPVIRQWIFLQRALTYPGGNVFIKGPSSSGRYSLTRFTAYMKKYHFVGITQPNNILLMTYQERLQILNENLEKIVIDCVNSNTDTIVFMRAGTCNQYELDMVIHFIETKNFFSFMSKASLELMYQKIVNFGALTPEKSVAAFDKIRDILCTKLHFALAVPETYDTSIHPTIYSIHFSIDKRTVYEQIAEDAVQSADYSNSKLNKLFADIHFKFGKKTLINQFYDFIDTFSYYAKNDKNDAIIMNDHKKHALGFLKQLEKDYDYTKEKIDQMGPILQAKNKTSYEYQKSFKEKQEAIEARVDKMNKDEAKYQKEVDEIAEQVSNLKNDCLDYATDVTQFKAKLELLGKSDLEILRNRIDNAPKMMRDLANVICILMYHDPNYDTEGKGMFLDPNLIDNLKRKIDYTSVTDVVVEKISDIYSDARFDNKEIEKISTALSYIYLYINSVYQYALRNSKLIATKEDLRTKEIQFKQFKSEITMERDSIEQVKLSLAGEMEDLNSSNNEQNEMKEQFNDLENRKRTIEKIFDGIEPLKTKWVSDTSRFQELMPQILSNNIYIAFYLVYCTSIPVELRKENLLEIKKAMKDSGLLVGDEDPFSYVNTKLALLDTHEEQSIRVDRMVSCSTELDARCIKSVLRTPLIYDPDEIVTKYIQKDIKSNHIVSTSKISPNFMETLSRSMKEGKSLFLYDVNYLSHELECLLKAELSANPSSIVEVQIGDHIVERHPKFKLYMFSSSPNLPKSLLSRVSFIDTSYSSIKPASDYIAVPFINYFKSENSTDLFCPDHYINQQKVEANKHEKELVELISDIISTQNEDSSYDFNSDNEILEDLLRTKENYLSSTSPLNLDSQIYKMEMLKHPFIDAIKMCQIIWDAASRYLPRVNGVYRFVYQNFLRIIKNGIEKSGLEAGTPQPDQQDALYWSVVNTVLKTMMQTLSLQDSIFFLFMVAFLKKKSEGKCSEDDLNIIIYHMKNEIDDICDTRVVDTRGTEAIEQLKFSNIINIFTFIELTILDQFGEEYVNNLPYFSFDQFFSSSSHIPSLILCKPEKDLTPLLSYFINTKLDNESFQFFSLFDDIPELDLIKKTTVLSIERGLVVALVYTKASTAIAGVISDIIEEILELDQNATARLIIIAHTTEFLPHNLLENANIVTYDCFPSIRRQMEEINQHFNPYSFENPLLKRLAYYSSLMYSHINYRRFVSPLGFTQFPLLGELTIQLIFEYIRKIIESKGYNEFPVLNIRESLEEVFLGGSCVDTCDFKKLKMHVESIFDADIMNDKGDVNFITSVPKLPIFGSFEEIFMSKYAGKPIRDWNLSRWVIAPFIALLPPEQNEIEVVKSRLASFLVEIPANINTADETKFCTPIGLFLLSEVERMNNGLNEISRQIRNQDQNVIDAVVDGSVPQKWNELIGNSSTRVQTKFLQFLKDKAKFLRDWVERGKVPSIIDIRFIQDIRGLMWAFISYIAYINKGSADLLQYKVTFSPKSHIDNSLVISNMYLMGAKFDQQTESITSIEAGESCFNKLPLLQFEPVEDYTKPEDTFEIPIYRSLPMNGIALNHDMKRTDGELNNYVYSIHMKSKLSERTLIANGTAIICHVSDKFA